MRAPITPFSPRRTTPHGAAGRVVACVAVAALVASLSLAAPAPAAERVADAAPVAGKPPAGSFAAMAYHSVMDRVVWFGGAQEDRFTRETWIWDGSAWEPGDSGTTPPARSAAAMVYDASRNEVVLFGGRGPDGAMADTWVWNGTWERRRPATSPPARFRHAMGYDAATGRVVLFGGHAAGAPESLLADTWTWDGTEWTRVETAAAPSPRAGARLAFDDRGHGVLFGGEGASSEVLGDTWTYRGGTWTQQAPPLAPQARADAALVFHAERQRWVMVGGLFCHANCSELPEALWTWDGTEWTDEQVGPHRPDARVGAAAAYDGANLLLFGGEHVLHWKLSGDHYVTTHLDDTWTWNGEWTKQGAEGATWSPLPGIPARRHGAGVAYDVARSEVVMFQGCCGLEGALPDTWTWDGAHWTQRPTPVRPPPRWWPAAAYDPVREETVLFGGVTGHNAVDRDDTWTWDGRRWRKEHPVHSPPPRRGAAMAHDPSSGAVLLFGGLRWTGSAFAYLDDTWLWDGRDWTEVQALSPPPGRQYAALVADASEGLLLFGGSGQQSSTLADTWTWNGTTWTNRDVVVAPPPRHGAGIAHDPTNGETVLFGGHGPLDVKLDDTWIWDGDQWRPGLPTGAPAPRSWPQMVYDARRGEVLLFGGSAFDCGTAARDGLAPVGGFSPCRSGGDDTWGWDGQQWTEKLIDAPPARTHGAAAYDSSRRQVVFFSGYVSNTTPADTWLMDESGWSQAVTATAPPGRQWGSSAFHPPTGKVVLYGGCTVTGCGPALPGTWTWDGERWVEEHPAESPPPLFGAAVAYDPGSEEVILFGGTDTDCGCRSSQTWAWDGLTWKNRTPAVSPPARTWASMAYDTPSEDLVLFGGYDGGARGDTWTWDGQEWHEEDPATSPPSRTWASSVTDPVSGRALLLGGFPLQAGPGFDDEWLWNDGEWVEQESPVHPTGRFGANAVAFPPLGGVVWFAGVNGSPGNVLGDAWLRH